jgi:hypothetical protein
MSESTKFGWDDYRSWRKALWISVLIASVLAVIGSRWLTHWGDYPAGLAALAAFACSNALQHYKCGRCRKSFFYDGMWFPWRNNCAHCNLPKWEDADYVNPDSEPVADRALSISEMAADQAIPASERISKFFLLVLRDDTGGIHLTLDSDGWADVQNLLTRANRYGFKLTREDLSAVMLDPEEHRFEWDQSGDRIRWSKG